MSTNGRQGRPPTSQDRVSAVRRDPVGGAGALGSRRVLLSVAAVCAALFALLYLLFVHTGPGRAADDRLRFAFVRGLDPVEPVGELFRTELPLLLAALVLLLAILAIRRRRRAAVLAVALIVPVASILAFSARLALPPAADGVALNGGDVLNTYPSSHVAATTALVFATLLLWPRRVSRGGLVTAGLLVGACALASVVTHAHRMSDVVGGVLLSVAVAAAVLSVTGVRPPARRRPKEAHGTRDDLAGDRRRPRDARPGAHQVGQLPPSPG